MNEPTDRILTRPPFVAGYPEQPSRLMPPPTAEQSPDLARIAWDMHALRAQVDKTLAAARSAYRWAVCAFLVALVAAVTASYTAYVIYTILNALRDSTNNIH
jgi:hypothetical protein